MRRLLFRLSAASLAALVGVGAAPVAHAGAVRPPGPRAGAGATADVPEAVLAPAPRYVPRGVRVLNAGTSGFLFAQEADDRLHWVDYRSGADKVLDQRLAKKPVYDVDNGGFDGLATSQGWYGDGSDTVALYTEGPDPQVALWNAAEAQPAVTRIPIPQGQTYVGTFGSSVLTRTGSWMETTSFHVLTSTGGAVSDRTVSGIPEGATFTSGVEDADARSVVIRYQEPPTTPGGYGFPHWGVLDLATAAVRVLPPAVPGGDTWDEADHLRLGPHAVYLQWRDRTYTRDRENPLNQLRESETHWILDASDFAVVGDAAIIGVRDINAGDNSYRGEQLRSGGLDGSGESDVLLQTARTGFATAPDGSVIVVGATAKSPDAALEWAIHRVTAKPDGHPQISRVVDVEPAPANVYGLALGSGILSVADESGRYQPHDILGGHRSAWLNTSGSPSPERVSTDRVVVGDDEELCPSTGTPRCVPMWASGDGLYGHQHPAYAGQTALLRNGATTLGPSLRASNANPDLADLSGRYAVLRYNSAPRQFYYGEFHDNAESSAKPLPGIDSGAVWGNTLWTSTGGVVSAATPPSDKGSPVFSTIGKCQATGLQAVGRWVYWYCPHPWASDLPGTAGVYDRQTGRTLSAPATITDTVLLGDGYFVAGDKDSGLTRFDLQAGFPDGGRYQDLPQRVLAGAADLSTGRPRNRLNWTVDRFGGHLAYVDQRQHIHVVPVGVAASALTVIDTAPGAGTLDAGAAKASWAAKWWLSKPAADWRLTFTRHGDSAAGRTLNGGAARGRIDALWDGRDDHGLPAVNGTYTWRLTARPADGQGPALTTSGTVTVIGGTPAPRDHTGPAGRPDGLGDLFAVTPGGVADFRPATGSGGIGARVSGSGWTGASTITAAVPFGDTDADRCNDVLIRLNSGELRSYHPACGAALTPATPYVSIGGGWNMHDALVSPGDLTGDGRRDLLARQATTGDLYLYADDGTGKLKARVKIGTGWKGYLLVGAGDLDGDGHGDILARDPSGVLWRYAGTGNATSPYKPRVRVGGGWQIYDSVVGVGDFTGDGHADLLARDAAGTLWRYEGTGTGQFAQRANIGGGWGMYGRLA